MKIVSQGKWDGKPESLPQRAHEPGAVAFREAASPEELAKALALPQIALLAVLLLLYFLRAGGPRFSFAGILLALLALYPHEILHALCIRGTAYLYTNLRQGMMFVTTRESLSRARFVFMSLLPNLLLGWLPYLAALIRPDLTALAYMGIAGTILGIGDYYNVYNALTQMPPGARTYLHGFHSYWYRPEK